MERFKNRRHAGMLLAGHLRQYANNDQVIVLGLARGGIPIAYEIGKKLCVSFDALIVRKLGAPGHEEFAIGAIADNGIPVFNQAILSRISISQEYIQHVVAKELQELNRRKKLYYGNHDLVDVNNKIIILVDDGLATGTTMLAAIQFLNTNYPKKIVVAVPVASSSACDEIAKHVNEVICLLKPEWFEAVGEWYQDFTQTTDQEVCKLLSVKNNSSF